MIKTNKTEVISVTFNSEQLQFNIQPFLLQKCLEFSNGEKTRNKFIRDIFLDKLGPDPISNLEYINRTTGIGKSWVLQFILLEFLFEKGISISKGFKE